MSFVHNDFLLIPPEEETRGFCQIQVRDVETRGSAWLFLLSFALLSPPSLLLVPPAAFFPILTKALDLLVFFSPDFHMVGICPAAFVSQQGRGLASSFLLLK